MKNAIVVGGSNGIGLSIVVALKGYDTIYIVDKKELDTSFFDSGGDTKYNYIPFDLLKDDYTLFDKLDNVNTLIITAGFGRLSLFTDIKESEIEQSFQVNTIGPMRVIHHLYNKISSNDEDFYCSVMVSISGHVSSPFFSVYSATKAALHRFIESINIELAKTESRNRILEVSPGSIKGTGFYGGKNDVSQTMPLAEEILNRMYSRETLYIPQYEEIFKNVIARYQNDPHQFGLESYDYKVNSGRIK